MGQLFEYIRCPFEGISRSGWHWLRDHIKRTEGRRCGGVGRKHKTISTQNAKSVNKTFPKGYEPPYQPGTQTKAVGLTPQQIQNKFALPTTPTHVTDVALEAGTQLRTSTANANGLFGYEGGGTQFDMMGQRVGEFTNGRLLP